MFHPSNFTACPFFSVRYDLLYKMIMPDKFHVFKLFFNVY